MFDPFGVLAALVVLKDLMIKVSFESNVMEMVIGIHHPHPVLSLKHK